MATAGSNSAAGLYKGAHQAKQPIHKAVLDGDDCKVIEATKWCCLTLHAVVEVRPCVHTGEGRLKAEGPDTAVD